MSSITVSLPNGQSAELRDHTLLKNKDRKHLLIKLDEFTGGDMARALSMTDSLIALLVTSWTLDLPIPSEDVNSLDELDIPTYDVLSAAAEGAQKSLFPSFQPDKDPASPTAPSIASAG